MSGRYTFNVERGATFVKELVWKGEDGLPIDLTGWTANLVVKVNIDDGTPALTMSTANSKITVNSVGEIILTLTAAETSALTFSTGTYHLELVNGTYVKRLLRGAFNVDKEVAA